MMGFLWSPDTQPDAALWVPVKSDPNEVELKNEIREFVIQADAQMKQLPTVEFVFGYPVTDRPRQQGERRPCFLAMPTKSWLPNVQRGIKSAANGFVGRLSVDTPHPATS
jgi:hypothetical protein